MCDILKESDEFNEESDKIRQQNIRYEELLQH